MLSEKEKQLIYSENLKKKDAFIKAEQKKNILNYYENILNYCENYENTSDKNMDAYRAIKTLFMPCFEYLKQILLYKASDYVPLETIYIKQFLLKFAEMLENEFLK